MNNELTLLETIQRLFADWQTMEHYRLTLLTEKENALSSLNPFIENEQQLSKYYDSFLPFTNKGLELEIMAVIRKYDAVKKHCELLEEQVYNLLPHQLTWFKFSYQDTNFAIAKKENGSLIWRYFERWPTDAYDKMKMKYQILGIDFSLEKQREINKMYQDADN